jgi:hypothetical protein
LISIHRFLRLCQKDVLSAYLQTLHSVQIKSLEYKLVFVKKNNKKEMMKYNILTLIFFITMLCALALGKTTVNPGT